MHFKMLSSYEKDFGPRKLFYIVFVDTSVHSKTSEQQEKFASQPDIGCEGKEWDRQSS